MSFENLVTPWLCKSLEKLGINEPTEIQQKCIPSILKGDDVIASAKTGSGKTMSFALPILEKLSEDPFGVFALILTPTRELAFQIAEQFRALGQNINLKQAVVVGGLDMMSQALELAQKPHIVVATPGRLVDHITSSSNTIHFKRLKFLVLDEADRLLDDTFADDLSVILDTLPRTRQTLLFTATITPEIESLSFSKRKPSIFICASRFDTVEKLDQRYIFIPSTVRDSYLTHVLREEEGKKAILFVGKSKTCEMLRIQLRELGIRSTALHGQMSQPDRISSLAKFKSEIVPILIATDVGSRGLDIPTVDLVINYELPADATDYIHRIGRTARAGRGGQSISIVTEKDVDILKSIEAKTSTILLNLDKEMTEYVVPQNKVLEILNEVSLARRVASLELLEKDFGHQRRIYKEKGTSRKVAKKQIKS